MAEQFATRGWLVHQVLLPETAAKLAERVRLEALWCVFKDEWKQIETMSLQGLNPTHLLTDGKLREKWLSNPKMVWRNGNMRAPLISKSCGMVNIYTQPDVRQQILFNPTVVETLRILYATLPEAETKETLCYALGPDRLGLKSKGATDMDRHLDSNVFLPCAEQSPRYRIQALVTLQIGTPAGKVTAADLGSIEVLQSFHLYYALAGWYFRNVGVTPFSNNGPYPFEELNKTHLPGFITWVRDYIYGTDAKPDTLKPYLEGLPKTYVEMKWVTPVVKAGELIAFDSRLPHRNTRNKSDVDRIVSYVSLYRQADWKRMGSPPILPKFTGEQESQHKGSNRKNPEEREAFDSVWAERVKFATDDALIKEVLGL
ncbi:Hypothetical protein POVN_LOCUS722 [uncultured virus]|nr:Hypothetical protein POVN_LOCUS722 [uncultured virus]